jgi:hypothetical protein
MEPEEFVVENECRAEVMESDVCRACLCAVDNSLESPEELTCVNFVELLNKTFGKLVNKNLLCKNL